MKTKLHSSIVVFLMLTSFQLTDAQKAWSISKIGFLGSSNASVFATRTKALLSALQDLGYVEGRSILIEYRWAEGKTDRLATLATELVGRNVDVLVTPGTTASVAAKKATNVIPIIFVSVGSPDKVGLVRDFARPGRNATGLTQVAQDLGTKRLEILKEAFPKTRVVAYIGAAATNPSADLTRKELESAAGALGLQIQFPQIGNSKDLEKVFASTKKEGIGVVVSSGGVSDFYQKRILDLAVLNRVPAIYANTEYAEAGGLMSYAPSYVEMYRRAATYVDKILKGAKPADLPVEAPKQIEFVVNLKTAKQIGLTIPPNVLVRADKVIK